MARRGENIRKRKDGRWEGRIRYGVNAEGKALTKYLYGHSYAECREKMHAFLQLRRTPKKSCELCCTYEALSVKWLEHEKLGVKQSSYDSYDYMLRQYVLPKFGKRLITEITKEEAEEWLTWLLEEGKSGKRRKDGSVPEKGGLSYSMVTNIVIVLKSVMAYGEELYHIENPLRRIKWPKPKNYRRDRVFTHREWDIFVQAMKRVAHTEAIETGMYTGLRLGEICGLQRGDIDLNERTIMVKRNIVRLRVRGEDRKTRLAATTPKTDQSKRILPYPDVLHETLREVCRGKEEGDYLFGETRRVFMNPKTLTTRYYRVLEAGKLRRVSFHTLRHTFATRCIEGGMDIKTLSEILGHSSVKLTLERYVHSSMDFKKKQINRVYENILPLCVSIVVSKFPILLW